MGYGISIAILVQYSEPTLSDGGGGIRIHLNTQPATTSRVRATTEGPNTQPESPPSTAADLAVSSTGGPEDLNLLLFDTDRKTSTVTPLTTPNYESEPSTFLTDEQTTLSEFSSIYTTSATATNRFDAIAAAAAAAAGQSAKSTSAGINPIAPNQAGNTVAFSVGSSISPTAESTLAAVNQQQQQSTVDSSVSTLRARHRSKSTAEPKISTAWLSSTDKGPKITVEGNKLSLGLL